MSEQKQYYEKIEIKSGADLPGESGSYFTNSGSHHYDANESEFYFGNVKWWLKALPEGTIAVSEEDLNKIREAHHDIGFQEGIEFEQNCHI